MKKKTIIIIILSLLLLFNIMGTYGYFKESFDKDIISKQVTIIDKYTIQSGHELSTGTTYMKGQDDNGEIIVIIGNEYNVGDKAAVYSNKNSLNASGTAPEWHTSIEEIEATSVFSVVLFSIFTITNALYLILYCKKSVAD